MVSATAANAEANRLRSEARDHKRAAARHRRQARELMGKLAELERECARLGIGLQINACTQSPGRHSDDGPSHRT